MKCSILKALVVTGLVALSLPSFGQKLTWPKDGGTQVFGDIGGSGDRHGVATTIFHGQIYMAYTSASSCDGSGECTVYITSKQYGGVYGSYNRVYNSGFVNTGYAVSTDNPALATAKVNGQEVLVLAVNSGGSLGLLTSTDGSTWALYGIAGAAYSISYSPSLAVDPSNPNMVYLGLQNANGNTPLLCPFNAASPASVSCQNLSNFFAMWFNPALAFWNNQLYMGFEERSSHCLYFYRYTPSSNSFEFWSPNSCSERTSASPSLAVHNGYLYVGFSTNDSSKKFTTLISTNGSDLGNRQQPAWKMDGPPNLLDLSPLGVNYLYNTFAFSNNAIQIYGY